MKISILNRHYLKRILSYWALFFIGFVLILVLGDLMASLKYYADLNFLEALRVFINQYHKQILMWLPIILPVSSLAAFVLLAYRLKKSGEYLALCSGSLSINMFFLPLVLGIGFLAAGFSWLNQEVWIPSLNMKNKSLREKTLLAGREHYTLVQGLSEHKTPFQASWFPDQNLLKDILIIDSKDIIHAKQGIWKKDHWQLKQVRLCRLNTTAMPHQTEDRAFWTWKTRLGPRQLDEMFRPHDYMTRAQLKKKALVFPKETILNTLILDRILRPFLPLFLIFLCFPFAFENRSGLFNNIRILLVALAFFMFYQICFKLAGEAFFPSPYFLALPLTVGLSIAIPLWKKIST
jgi:lipopolysaccharide export LptBFGC system permease protein LptF